jgi:hypothetical protein
MHTLTCKRGGEQIRLRNVPTTTALQLVSAGVARFADHRTQKEVQTMIQALSGKRTLLRRKP